MRLQREAALRLPWPPGGIDELLPVEIELSPENAAERFWTSPWAANADGLESLSPLVIRWLTAPLNTGGMEASWHDREGLRAVVDAIEAARPS